MDYRGWRPLNDKQGMRMDVTLQVKVRVLYARYVCDTKAPLRLRYVACGLIG